MRRKRTMAVAVLCGLVCAACVFLYTQGVRGEVDSVRAEAMAKYGGEQLEVCVASRDIAAGEVVSAADVETRMWLVDLLPGDAVRNVADVVGKQTSSSILAGEVVSTQRFQSVDSVIDVPQGMCAVSVPAKEVQAVGGAIAPGSLVDVYATGSASADVLAHGVQVLATGQALKENSSSSSSNVSSWVTLAVLPNQVQELVAAAAKAELYFALPGSVRSGSFEAGAEEKSSSAGGSAGEGTQGDLATGDDVSGTAASGTVAEGVDIQGEDD